MLKKRGRDPESIDPNAVLQKRRKLTNKKDQVETDRMNILPERLVRAVLFPFLTTEDSANFTCTSTNEYSKYAQDMNKKMLIEQSIVRMEYCYDPGDQYGFHFFIGHSKYS